MTDCPPRYDHSAEQIGDGSAHTGEGCRLPGTAPTAADGKAGTPPRLALAGASARAYRGGGTKFGENRDFARKALDHPIPIRTMAVYRKDRRQEDLDAKTAPVTPLSTASPSASRCANAAASCGGETRKVNGGGWKRVTADGLDVEGSRTCSDCLPADRYPPVRAGDGSPPDARRRSAGRPHRPHALVLTYGSENPDHAESPERRLPGRRARSRWVERAGIVYAEGARLLPEWAPRPLDTAPSASAWRRTCP